MTRLEQAGAGVQALSVHRFARGPVIAVAVVVGAAQLVAGVVGRGYWFDEMYMLVIGRYHLDWGSADQPPLTPLVAAVMDMVAPGSIVVLRLPAVLATAGAVVVAALVARELGGDWRAQTLTAAAQATTLWITMAGHWLAPYTLEPVQWLVLSWLLLRWIRLRDDRLLLVLGAVAGIAAQTKFQVLLLCAVLLLSVLVCGPRELLRRPLLWAGVGIGALITLPTLVWQAVNGWPQLRMGSVVASEALLYGGRTGVAVLLLASAGVAGVFLGAYGLWSLLRSEEYRFLAVAFVVLYVFFVVTIGRPYYLGGFYAVLAAAGALGLQRRREAGRLHWRWTAWPAFALSAAAAGVMLWTSIAAVDESAAAGERIAGQAAIAYQALSPEQRADTVLMGQSYIVAAVLDGYATQRRLPEAYSGNRGYGWFPPPSEDQHTVLFVGSDPDDVRPYFAECLSVSDGGSDARVASVWLCTGRQQPWTTLWPRLRSLTVD